MLSEHPATIPSLFTNAISDLEAPISTIHCVEPSPTPAYTAIGDSTITT